MKCNEWGFMPHLCLDGEMNAQAHNSKFIPWRFEVEIATSRSRNIESLRVSREETFCFYET